MFGFGPIVPAGAGMTKTTENVKTFSPSFGPIV